MIAEMHDYGAGAEEIRSVVTWILTQQPHSSEIRAYVSDWKRHVRSGQTSIFEQDINVDVVSADRHRIQVGNTSMQIGSAVKEITMKINSLTHLLSNGLAGDAIAHRPVAATLDG